MESGGEITEALPSTSNVQDKIFVAVGKDVKESKSTLLWALRNSGRDKICILHVHQPPRTIPLMGGNLPISAASEKEARLHQDHERQKMHDTLNEYLSICLSTGVQAEKLDIEMDSIEQGIVELIAQHGNKKLVMGAAADKHYSKRMMDLKSKKAIYVSKQAHSSCHIWFICRGNLIYTREGSSKGSETEVFPTPMASPSTRPTQSASFNSGSLLQAQNSHVRLTNPVQDLLFRLVKSDKFVSHRGRLTASSSSEVSGEMAIPRIQSSIEVTANGWEMISRSFPSQSSGNSTWSSIGEAGNLDTTSMTTNAQSDEGLSSLYEPNEDLHCTSPANDPVEQGPVNDELYDQLLQAMADAENSKQEAFEESVRRRKAERDAIEAIRRAKASEMSYEKEKLQRKEMEELLAKEKRKVEKMKSLLEQATEELQIAQGKKSVLERQICYTNSELLELEEKLVLADELILNLKNERDELEKERESAVGEALELRKKMEDDDTSISRMQCFSEFSAEEIKEATQNFDPALKIGEGGCGSVYRGHLRHTQVAIKMLHSHSSQGLIEFQREVDVLSRVRHQNLVTLIGTCPEMWCLIYEYLPNGSLEDRLACKDNTPPLSWQMRTRIAAEMCSALMFLHSHTPHRIVHGDLKPANILLDANFVSKLGDFGICRFIPHDEDSACWRTDPKGTFAYADPEFLSTGELTPKSDVYSFGVVLLRLLTGRPPLGIMREMQYALEKDNLDAVLDASAGNWPFVQARQLAHLALRCCEISRKNRPELRSDPWRVLEPMKASCAVSSSAHLGPVDYGRVPSYFICPVFQEIMRDPHIAADGYTYEAEALKAWIDSGHDTSPMTNLKLAHCNLIPNHALRSAIQEWLQNHP
ncbi:PREDICTED: U-box domain-containing protein 33-like isoform X2 [Nelumbo nucifera]|uniref:RING-type E3 ubiquitin transferase n=1 Tax=Nelumbo nucifera TaxID=4432 RepID=A0A1U7Z516_NELNU|nr:PREDICTED: U-box domain-containing protein 33-like isoform X2 [Nelumbo nucifera]